MADDDRDGERPDDDEAAVDPDRAAILARRQRFIAIALSGLAGAAACDKPKPQPCLSPPATSADGGDDPSKADPKPCLKIEPVNPQPCLEVMPPEDTKGDPQPCLKVAAPPDAPPPQVCLKVAPTKPQPCLDVSAPEEPEPKPQPCLRVRPPDPKPTPKPQPCLKIAPKDG